MKIEELKDQARKHEQKEEWSQAMRLYSRALEHGSEQQDADIALHNRLGDLKVRVGDLTGAVEAYEKAIELYLEADLANNAMAVCRKLERNAPDRPTVLLRMGEIRVQQGFVVDARQDFLSYAEIQIAAGDQTEALRALEHFAGLAPHDVETRLFLAQHLHHAERKDDALGYLREAHRILRDAGEDERAEAVRAQAAEMDPEFDFEEPSRDDLAPLAEGLDERDAGLSGFESTSLVASQGDDPAPDLPVEDPPNPEGEGAELEGLEFSGMQFEEFDDADEEGLTEPTVRGADHGQTAAARPAEEPDPFDRAFDDAFTFDDPEEEGQEEDGDLGGGGLEELPLLDAGGPTRLPDEEEEAGWEEEEGWEEEAQGFEPLLEAEAEDEDRAEDRRHPSTDEPLSPLAGPGVAAAGGAEVSLTDLRHAVEADPDDADAWRLLGVALFDEDREDEAREALARAHMAYGEQNDPERAMRVMRELIFHEPEEIEHYKRLVEYAHRTGDRALLVPAFLELAEALVRTGAARKAEAVYGQVIALDPRNPRARQALSVDGPGEDGVRSRAPSGEGFVDLGGMVLDEPVEPSFRWTVPDADADPSGDEEADFARMLSRFKEKVATNLPSDDATAHYDLGAAYKDMGLLDEAVSQFQSALRAHPGLLAAYEMVGQCFLEKDEPEFAVRSLRRALEVDYGVEDELLGIYYYLGRAYEGTGDRALAREFYERVFSLDINFRDVTDRLRGLR
jgi:tetratricopeptide (TPR) repeat protein